MTSNINRTQVDISRKFKNTTFALQVHIIWAFFILLIFGLFGIYPQVRIMNYATKTKEEMETINKSLENKIEVITKETDKVTDSKKGIEALDRILPKDYEVQNYVVDFSFAASEAGYALVSFNADPSEDLGQTIPVSAVLKGNGSIGNLIKSVESIKRAAQVTKVSFADDRSEKKANLNLNILILD